MAIDLPSRFMASSVFSRLIGIVTVVGIVALVTQPALAKRQEYVNPEAESIVVACRKLNHMDERETCIQERSEGLVFGEADTRLMWEKVLIDIEMPMAINLSVDKRPSFQEGPSLIIGNIEDVRQFEKFIGYNLRKSPSSDDPGDSSVNDGLIGRATHTSTLFRQKTEVWEVRLGKGKTVSALIREAVTSGFEQAGYRVIDSEVEPSAEGVRIDIEIDRFWLWNEDLSEGWEGWADVDFIGVIVVKIKAATSPFQDSISVNGRATLRGSNAGRKRSWTNTGNAVLKNLALKVTAIANIEMRNLRETRLPSKPE